MAYRLQLRNWKRALATLLWLASGALLCHAAVLTRSQVATNGEGEWPASVTVNIGKFNQNFGTLQSVQFELHGYFDTGTVSMIENLDSVASNFTSLMTASSTADWAGSPTTHLANAISQTSTDNIGAFDGTADFAGTDYKSVSLTGTTVTLASYTVPNDGSWANFTGTGTQTFTVTLNGFNPALDVSVSGGSKFWGVEGQTYIAVEFSAVYTFIPEPVSLLIFGVGCAFLGLRRPRRRTDSQ